MARTYTVGRLARLAGVSVRTLHHYEAVGLLAPGRAPNGYRVYGANDAERLQRILLLRSCGMALEDIRRALDNDTFDYRGALTVHLANLEQSRTELDELIGTVRRTIAELEGGAAMADDERFRGMKERVIEENERRWGAEARKAYGDEAVDGANARMRGLSPAQWAEVERLEGEIVEQLERAMETGDPEGPEAVRLCELHRRWLEPHWAKGTYSPQAHAGLAEMYVADPRFTAYYDDRAGEGAAQFLRDAIVAWCGRA